MIAAGAKILRIKTAGWPRTGLAHIPRSTVEIGTARPAIAVGVPLVLSSLDECEATRLARVAVHNNAYALHPTIASGEGRMKIILGSLETKITYKDVAGGRN